MIYQIISIDSKIILNIKISGYDLKIEVNDIMSAYNMIDNIKDIIVKKI